MGRALVGISSPSAIGRGLGNQFVGNLRRVTFGVLIARRHSFVLDEVGLNCLRSDHLRRRLEFAVGTRGFAPGRSPTNPRAKQMPPAQVAPRGPTSRERRPPGRARALPLPAGRPHESPLFIGLRTPTSPTRCTRTRSRGPGSFRPATPRSPARGRGRHRVLPASPGRLRGP